MKEAADSVMESGTTISTFQPTINLHSVKILANKTNDQRPAHERLYDLNKA